MKPGLSLELILLLDGLWIQLKQLAGYWIAGLIAGSLISVYLSEKIINRIVTFQSKRFSLMFVCAASVLGIISPLCMYGTVPLIVSLSKKHVPSYILAAFMVSSILLNPNLFLMSFALGAPIALLRLALCCLGGILAGLLVRLVWKDGTPFHFERFSSDRVKKKRTFIQDLLRAFQVTAPYFFIGILITALYDRYFPKEWMAPVFGGSQMFGTLFAASLSIPLYACGGGAIPLLAAWLHDGMSIGAAVTFMLAGPATKFTNLGAVKIILGIKNFIIYLLYCLSYAILSGIVIDFLRLRI